MNHCIATRRDSHHNKDYRGYIFALIDFLAVILGRNSLECQENVVEVVHQVSAAEFRLDMIVFTYLFDNSDVPFAFVK